MRYVKPDYYDSFRCLAGKCPATCCAGWQIMIDEDTLEKYSTMGGRIGNRLASEVDWREGCFKQYDGRCAFLNANQLCDLVTEAGEASLCETCSQYPRHVEEFADLREFSLSLSCPEAARIIFSQEKPWCFLVEEDGEPDPLEEEFEAFDYFLFTQLEDARKLIFQMLADRELSLEQRMQHILALANQMQDCIEEEKVYEIGGVLEQFGGKEALKEVPEDVRYQRLKAGFPIFYRLEHLSEDWEELLQETWETLYAGSYEDYRKIRQEFAEQFAGGALEKSSQGMDWELFKENLLQFFLYTYFCGAVYDEWVYSKAALAVFSVCFLEEFVMSSRFLSDKNISRQKCEELAYRYAREIEHSDDNLNLLEEWLQQNR